jgi:hypothetical protein
MEAPPDRRRCVDTGVYDAAFSFFFLKIFPNHLDCARMINSYSLINITEEGH